MSCERLQVELSGAIDEGRDLSAYRDHLRVCSECDGFLSASLEIASRYRHRVTAGILLLRRSPPPAPARRRWLRPLLPLCAALLVIALSLPARRVPLAAPLPGLRAAARVVLFDGIPPGPLELPVLAWSGEAPLPRRLDQDLPPSLGVDLEPAVALPPGLRF